MRKLDNSIDWVKIDTEISISAIESLLNSELVNISEERIRYTDKGTGYTLVWAKYEGGWKLIALSDEVACWGGSCMAASKVNKALSNGITEILQNQQLSLF